MDSWTHDPMWKAKQIIDVYQIAFNMYAWQSTNILHLEQKDTKDKHKAKNIH